MADHIEIEHSADMSFRVQGRDLRELFEKAACSMLYLQSERTGPAAVVRDVSAEAEDRETLLVNYLNEILYLQDVHLETYYECRVQGISDTSLQGQVMGEERSGPCKLIKAVTFHNLKIEPAPGGLQATIVMDV